jgi:hypothetical protein
MTLIHDHEVCPGCTHTGAPHIPDCPKAVHVDCAACLNPQLSLAHSGKCWERYFAAEPECPHWEAKYPTERGWYWYRNFFIDFNGCRRENRYIALLNEVGLFEVFGWVDQAIEPKDMLRCDGEFWSEKLEEPK